MKKTHPLIDFHNSTWHTIEGTRIVDINYVMQWMCAVYPFHRQSCENPEFNVVSESNRCMVSTITLQCKTCKAMFSGKTENPNQDQQIRRSCVWATITSGETHAHAEEFLAHIGIPFMCFEAFEKTEHAMYDIVKHRAEESMVRAIEEEKSLCTEFDELGVPCTRAYLDGSWPIRSYGNKYQSRSGAAVVLGGHTGKVIHADSRNTFCIQCFINKRDNKVKEHKCFVNYIGSAGSMEPDILVHGFNQIFKQGLKVRTVIGDGDSTVFDQLKDKCVYGEELQKSNCKNHTLKNLKKHLHVVSAQLTIQT